MAIIKCKMCGGDIELAGDKTFGTCEFCGSTMTLPKIDDDQRAAAFNRGNHFRRIGEFDKALAVYERIVREDDRDAEAHWCCALCRFGIEYVEDPATYEYLPTCHRASFDSFLEDVDYLAAVEYSEGVTKRQYQKDGAKIAEVQRGILATSQNEDPFDVFICYKESDESGERTRDSLMAQDVYYQLVDQGYRVFFSRITLEDMAGKQYEPYIFAALNSAKVMIVIGTKAEYMNAVWVKNEWSRFLTMMKKDRHKLLLPCYRDMDPYDMPEQLSVLQSYDMSKIGFIQDLIRGIKKVLDAEKKTEVIHETTTVTQAASNTGALLKRGNMALEDGEWDKAEQFFEEVLNQDAECAAAYIGTFLAQCHCTSIENHVEQVCSNMEANVQTIEKTAEQERLVRDQWLDRAKEKYCKTGVLSEEQIITVYPKCTPYSSEQDYWVEQKEYAENYLMTHKQLYRALDFSNVQEKAVLQEQLEKMKKLADRKLADAQQADAEEEARIVSEALNGVDEKLEQLESKIRNVKEEQYQYLCLEQKCYVSGHALRTIAFEFRKLGAYKDSLERAKQCEEKIKILEQESRERQKKNKEAAVWMSNGRCSYCGGSFTGLFVKKCAQCGKPKSY